MNETLKFYNDNALSYVDETINANMENLYALFQKYVASGARILDFGCGSGRDTKYFSEQGYIVDAIDGSAELCRIAAEYTGLPVRNMLFNELDADSLYDGIWACSSILHIPKAELPDIFARLHKALAVGGYLYTSFKFGDFCGERNGRFFSDFTLESLEEMIKDVPGFEIVETAITADVRQGRENEKWLNIVLRRNG